MRDYPLTNGYTQEPENLRLGISYAVFSEFRPSDDPELYTKNGQTIIFHYPFLFKDKLFTLKLAPCDQPMNTVLRKEYTSEWRADGIDHLLEALGKSRYVGPFIGELTAKAEEEKNKLREWVQG